MRDYVSTRFAHGVKIAVLGLLLAGIYYSTFSWLILHDWPREDYNYCYLIPFVVLYLLWEKRFQLGALPSRPAWHGAVVLGCGLVFFWLGELAGELFTQYLSFWLVIVGLCWLFLGGEKLKTILFPLVMVLTMFPLPHFVNTKITLKLKLLSSQLGVAMLHLYGMSAYREGNIIDLGFTQLQVVDACSGLRYLTALVILGLLVAYFYRASLWKKALVVLSTVPLAIVSNSLRIALTGILYETWGAKVAEGFFHGFSGWFIFMVTLGALLGEIWLLERVGKNYVAASRPTAARMNDVPREVRTGVRVFLTPHFTVAVLLLGATLALAQGIEFREKTPMAKSFASFPLTVDTWQGTRNVMEQQFVETLDLSDYVIIDYTDDSGKRVNFYVAYYESQRKGESIHSPATCLPGSGWVFRQSSERKILLPKEKTVPVNRAMMQKGADRQVAYYWFPQRGRILTNAYQLKLYAFWDALTRQRTDGALVRLITPVSETETVADADLRLQEFTRVIVPVLEEFIPGKNIIPE